VTGPPAAGPPRDGGSVIRLIAGAVLVIGALSGATIAFVRLTQVLDAGGYGTGAMRNVLIMLGVAGACLGAGIATLIWDIAKRYER
jgi:hypothetical protein